VKVKELIKLLEGFNQEAIVTVGDWSENWYDPFELEECDIIDFDDGKSVQLGFGPSILHTE
jgi:hypothetical protein